MSSSSLPPTPLPAYPDSGPNSSSQRRKPPPIFISVNRADVDPLHLRDLLSTCGISCHRFPRLDSDDRPEPVNINKLRTALANSTVVVSAFCKSRFASGEESVFGFEALFDRALYIPPAERRLVGFGRAVSDGGLTASIHDVAVIPSLQRLGIGRKIVQKIIRILTDKDIYDVSALCSEKERLFFRACSFGSDFLGSTTMMYTKTSSIYPEEDLLVKHAGQLILSVPPLPKPFILKRRPSEDGSNVDIIC